MFTVTNKAAAVLKGMLEKTANRPEGHTFRLGFDEAGKLSLFWDEPVAEDHFIQVNDETVLLIDKVVWDQLDDVIMDAVETDEGPRLNLGRQTD